MKIVNLIRSRVEAFIKYLVDTKRIRSKYQIMTFSVVSEKVEESCFNMCILKQIQNLAVTQSNKSSSTSNIALASEIYTIFTRFLASLLDI